jgi:hypothetical protein
VVFARNWVVLVNGEFLTADTIYDRTMIFVNCDRLNEFFGINIEWDYEIATGRLMGKPVSAVWSNGKLYASIADLVPPVGRETHGHREYRGTELRDKLCKARRQVSNLDVSGFKEKPTIDVCLITPFEKGQNKPFGNQSRRLVIQHLFKVRIYRTIT